MFGDTSEMADEDYEGAKGTERELGWIQREGRLEWDRAQKIGCGQV